MILHGLEVEQVRRFADPVRLAGLGPGLNLLGAPNESGKSTLLAALRAVFLLQHGSKSRPIADLQPYGGKGAPRIAVDFTVDGTMWRLEKRFLHRPFAQLSGDGATFQGDAAEARLHALIGVESSKRGTEALGLMNALWVGQGHSLAQPDFSDPARATLRACLESDLGAMTGGEAAERILARVLADLSVLLDGRGNPKGRYRAAIEGEQAASDELARLQTRRQVLEDDLQAMADLRRRLAREDDSDRREKEREHLAEARRQRDRLRDHDARHRAARAALDHATARLAAVRQDVARRAEWRQALDAQSARRAGLAEALAAARAAHDAAQTAQAARMRAVQDADAYRLSARRALDRATRRVERTRLEQERRDAAASLDRLDQAAQAVTRAAARLSACTVDEARMTAIRQADRAVQAARAASQAQATMLDVVLEGTGAGRLKLDGRVLGSGRVQVTDTARLHIAGIGTVSIEPASHDRERLRADAARADHALRQALDAAGCVDPDAAEAALAERRQADLAFQAAQTTLAGLLVAADRSPAAAMTEGRRRLAELEARIARHGDEDGNPAAGQDPAEALERASDAMQAAEDRHAAANQALFAPDETLRLAAAELGRLEGDHRLAQDAASRLTHDLAAARAAESDDALSARLAAEDAAMREAGQALHRIEETRPDGTEALADAAIQRLERAIQDGSARLAALKQDMAAREARIRAAEGDGLDERIAAQDRLRDSHAAERAACAREVAILHCLRDAVAGAARAATERYLAPLSRAIQPALAALFPRAVATVDPDFRVSGLTRRVGEPFENLSDGTREQIAVLVRLGLAELLRARGRPAMLVLDDALTWSDAGRLDRMFDILADAATRVQVLILTCRTELFTGLGARALTIESATPS
ncbi:hypothetical protein HLH33_10465 [Gluconacetobacter diazotrophicus]|uniref:Rad50/SbcC-type AAA domain-containing protein n=1 Tax=Gluconacetobacter diazotrophicus TaxID=33996 RepID=A0A7W4I5N5_GLUDI|nr:hypothetical protein [Gluconacetobacter diazotrophicus]MBB2156729.1 hypothetical protein [Gluconacetobacter diazotrophicus]